MLEGARRVVLPTGIHTTAGPRITAVAAAVGLELDQWQAEIVDVALAKTAEGRWAADTVGISIPRQAGKTYLVGAVAVAYCLTYPGSTVAWTAHHSRVMLETFTWLKRLATLAPLDAYISRIPSSAEYRAIEFFNGSRIVMTARESGALRGVAKVALLVLDEAQILSDNAISDVMPTQLRADNPLTIALGTPPRPKDPSEFLGQQRRQALEAYAAGLPLDGAAWIEFSADDDADTDDPAQLRKANPSYPKRTPLRAIRKLRRTLTEDHYRREVLGIWDDLATPAVIDPAVWAAALDQSSRAITKLVLAVDVSPDRGQASVALAGYRADGLIHVEIDESRAGAGWVIDWVRDRCANNDIAAVVVDGKGPAGSLIRDLRAFARVVITTTDEMTDACAKFQDSAVAGTLRHIGQPQLTVALNSARRRSVGDRWAWNRKTVDSDITPIVAATLAHWGVDSRRIRGSGSGTTERKGRILSW